MAQPLRLLVPRLRKVPRGFKGPIQQRFERFHLLNPGIYDLIVNVARDLKERGFSRCGMKFIFERLRWLYALETQGEEFKLSNDFTAFYARLVMHREPELRGFFKLREQRIEYDPSSTR